MWKIFYTMKILNIQSKNYTWLFVFALTVCVALVVLGCDENDDPTPVRAKAVARVGDTAVTKEQLRPYLPLPSAKIPAARQFAIGQAIRTEWILREAKRQDIKIPVSQVTASLSVSDARTGPALARAETAALENELALRVKGRVTEQEATRYLRAHPRLTTNRQMRYMSVVATSSRARAIRAKQALERGREWTAVIDRYSTANPAARPASVENFPSSAGELTDAPTAGKQPFTRPNALGRALFSARRGTFNGPVKTKHAWYVFELRRIDQLPSLGLQDVANGLTYHRLSAGRNALRRSLEARYRRITVCSKGNLVPECRNGPRSLPITKLVEGP